MYSGNRNEYCDLSGHIRVTPSAYGLFSGCDEFESWARGVIKGIGELETFLPLNRAPAKEGVGGKES